MTTIVKSIPHYNNPALYCVGICNVKLWDMELNDSSSANPHLCGA